MVKKFEPLGRNKAKPAGTPFELKMTPEKKAEAEKMFQLGVQSCSDIAKSLGVTENTLRRYFRKECADATERNLERARKILLQTKKGNVKE